MFSQAAYRASQPTCTPIRLFLISSGQAAWIPPSLAPSYPWSSEPNPGLLEPEEPRAARRTDVPGAAELERRGVADQVEFDVVELVAAPGGIPRRRRRRRGR